MADEAKKVEDAKKPEEPATTAANPGEAFKTVKIEIIKFHPLVAHEVGDEAIVREETATELIEKGYAKKAK